MDMMDSRDQVKIWNRVRSETPPVTEGLAGLAAGAMARTALYGALARQTQGAKRSILLQLLEEEMLCVRCLKGVYRMAADTSMYPASTAPSAEKPEAALRKCYGQSLKALAAFEQRAYDPEFGPVFSLLAAKKREHCWKIAELIGLLEV